MVQDALIYEVHVRAFYDSNGDGVGDFAGLTQKLPYLQDLGVTCLWLLPFYPSPLKDDGYDIADYTSINPIYGSLDDFRRFVDEAHARHIRVLTELVINHTSDQHPWFQRARHAPKGSPERDYYVWSDTDDKYAGTRIIFIDTEKSNWTFDPVAGQYYWHRFFSHQPDLNLDNPEVLEAVIDVMRFWLDLGVDALRLDAIPYLIEREGTINENLPETHAVLKQIRRELDAQYRGTRAAGRSQPVAVRRARLLRGRRRMPHGVPLPADAAHVHGPSPGRAPSDRRDHEPDAGDPGDLPVGDLPPQSRRADARDGDRRRARLHVLRSTPPTRRCG